MTCCVSTDVRTWTNWLTFEPDPDYTPDAGTGLLSPISHKRFLRYFTSGKCHVYVLAAARRGFKMVLFTEQSKHLCRRYLRCTECPSTWKWCNSGAAVLTADRVEWTRFVTNTDGPLAWQWSWDQRISLCNHLCNSKAVFQDGCKCSIELFYPCLSCFLLHTAMYLMLNCRAKFSCWTWQ